MEKIKLAPQSTCTGCSACADVCPKQCITMQAQGSLHLYPVIDRDACIECGRCMQVCPDLSLQPKHSDTQHYYAAWTTDEKCRRESTSGGVGSALVRWALDKGYVIYGAAFDKSWNLSHMAAQSLDDADRFRRSKYLQSSTTGVFKDINERLKNGEKVLFIGTPCQVAGLLKLVPAARKNNLVTVDIICHGVNSPIVWKDYVNYLQQHFKAELEDYNFRDKSDGWQRNNGSANLRVAMRFSNGKTISERSVYNQFHYWFGKHLILRQACLNCIYRSKERVSDITIGDFWGVEKVIPGIDTKEGVSAVIANTPAGNEIIRACNIWMEEVDGDKASATLKGFIEYRSLAARDRDAKAMLSFTDDYFHNSFAEQVRRYKAPTKLEFFILRLKSFLRIK